MKKLAIILLLLLTCGCQKNIIKNEVSNNNEKYYGYLIVPSINMIYGFYDIDNDLNNVDKNVTLLNSNIKNTYILAAHSGTGHLAYFNDLRYLKKGNKIHLKFENNTNEYEIINIRSEPKTGKIKIKNEENQLILTTCDQIRKGNQLIIEATLIDDCTY